MRRRSVLRAVGAGAWLATATVGERAGAVAAGVGDESDREAGTSGLELARARNAFYSRQAVAGKKECFRPDQREIYGPTDINAQSSNGRLAVAVNRAGTMTVLRWPRPSFYDQLKYFTLGRDANHDIEVLPNEGAFLGLTVDTGGGFETTWLRDWTSERQRYANDADETDAEYSDEVVTEYANDDIGLRVTVRDVAALDVDAFVRRVEVVRTGRSPVERARLVAFENVNPVVSKHPQYPTQDWCTEETNQDRARYDPALDAVVHAKSGVDESTGEAQSVTIAMGFGRSGGGGGGSPSVSESAGHQVGGDAYEPAAAPAGQGGPTRDAYDDASDPPLSNNDRYVGQTTGALTTDLEFAIGPSAGSGRGGVATETVVFAAGHTVAEAGDVLENVRGRSFEDVRTEKEAWFDPSHLPGHEHADDEGVLSDAPLPDLPRGDPARDAVLNLCRRALVTLVTDTGDRPAPADATREKNRAIVASVATQAPYGEDWPRDGAYFNYALELIGLHEWVADRCRWYADVQQNAVDPRPSHPNTPPGNWAMNYYGDGVAGGPIPYEIDETGYALWTMWDHYRVTGDREYLGDVYPAIQRGADFLVECRDPSTGLHCRSWEDDRFFELRQTIVGAALVWLGLDAAARAADVLDKEDDSDRYATRRDEVGRGIDEHLYDTEEGAYGARAGFAMAEVAWPVCFTPYVATGDDLRDGSFSHPRIQDHLDTVWKGIAPAFENPEAVGTGQYEVKGLLPLAKARRDEGPGSLDQVREGIRWIATEHATDDTHVMGEAWKIFDGEVRSIVSQPHAWEQVLTYMAALEAWPPIEKDDFEAGTCGSVLEALRRRNAPD